MRALACRRVLVRGVSAAALGGLAVACASAPAPTTYDLTAPQQGVRGGGAIRGQIAVSEPVTVQPLDADRIIVKDASDAVSFLGGGQWADRLPRLIQARLIQTFENASRLRAVSRSGDAVTADYVLISDLRAFQIEAATGEAVVEMSVKLVNDSSGRIVIARVFRARVPVGAIDAAAASNALDRALSMVLIDIVRWIGTGGSSVSSRASRA